MFENIQPQPPQPKPATPSAKPAPVLPPQTPPVAAHVFVDRAQADLFKRTGLTFIQKIILVIISVVVLIGIIGGGIWLYVKLQPFDSTATPKNSNQATNNSNIPLQELDTDRDGLRDIDERRYGTDINKTDTDGDGYSDWEEVTNGYDPKGPGKLQK